MNFAIVKQSIKHAFCPMMCSMINYQISKYIKQISKCKMDKWTLEAFSKF